MLLFHLAPFILSGFFYSFSSISLLLFWVSCGWKCTTLFSTCPNSWSGFWNSHCLHSASPQSSTRHWNQSHLILVLVQDYQHPAVHSILTTCTCYWSSLSYPAASEPSAQPVTLREALGTGDALVVGPIQLLSSSLLLKNTHRKSTQRRFSSLTKSL